jgi:hypothetical protein
MGWKLKTFVKLMPMEYNVIQNTLGDQSQLGQEWGVHKMCKLHAYTTRNLGFCNQRICK